MEPFKIKVVEALPITTREERIQHLITAGFEPFLLQARHVTIDLTTDSGTSAMSQNQWAAMMGADESYKNSTSFERFVQSVRDITKFKHVAPVHQGRAAENILFRTMLSKDSIVAGNGFFFTTRNNISRVGGSCLEIPCAHVDGEVFGGNIDCERLADVCSDKTITLVIITATNNERVGQPVSMSNLRQVHDFCKAKSIPLFMDGCRFAENAYLIKEKEIGFAGKSVRDIVAEMFSYVDGCFVSAKKDGLANTGGFFATNDQDVFEKFSADMMWTEGSLEYGGLAGRDLDAIAIGLAEVVDDDYLRYRLNLSREFGMILKKANIPVIEPQGFAIFVDAEKMLPHIHSTQYPARSLNCALYIEGGVKGVHYTYNTGTTFADGHHSREVLRLSLPRRVYTLSHFMYVGTVFKKVMEKAADISGLRRASEKINYAGARMIPIQGFILASETSEDKEEP